MKIALIDGGISRTDNLKNKIAIKKEFVNKERTGTGKLYSLPVHGTTCAEIICSICSDVEFLDLTIMYPDGTTQILILLEALDWCIENKVKLIHMSVGTVNYFDIKPLEVRIKKLLEQNAIIVAAYHNENIRTYPAAFGGVFGVRQDQQGLLNENQFLFQEQPDFQREGSIVAHWWGDNGMNPANSYAAPVITGHIAAFLNENPEAVFDNILNYLEEKAIHNKVYPNKLENVIKKEKTIAIPIIAIIDFCYREVNKLIELFKEKKYHTLLLQKNPADNKAVPIGHYGGTHASLASILYTVNVIYEPDIIFLQCISGKMYSMEKISEIDAYIFFEDGVYKIYIDRLIKTTKKQEIVCDAICQYFE